MFNDSIELNEVSKYNILIINFEFLKDNDLQYPIDSEMFEKNQIESIDAENDNTCNLNNSFCESNMYCNDLTTKMQTNNIQNNQHYNHDCNNHTSNDDHKYNNSYDLDANKENQENQENQQNEVKEEKNITSSIQKYNYYGPQQIKYLFEHEKQFIKIKNSFLENDIDEETQKLMKPPLIGKKRKRRTASEIKRDKIEMEKNKDKEVPKRGRRPKNYSNNNDSEKGISKLRLDNIMKKVKGRIFKDAIQDVNSLLTEKSKKYSLKNLGYEFINQLKRKVDLEYLDMPLKILFSKSISDKYSSFEKEINEKNIQKILELEKDNVKINAVLNMTFREWIDVFTMKKKLENEIQIDGIGEFLEEILENNKEPRYFSLFVFCLYNYENWFLHKKGRNS
jgi:hypothetical protein